MYLDYGNLAHQYAVDEKEQLAIRRKQELEKKKKAKQQMKLRRKLRARTVITICTMLSLAFVIVYGQVRQYELSCQIDRANNELNSILDEKSRALLNIEKTRNLTNIETVATTELGMNKATSDQIIYLNLVQKDKVETAQTNKSVVHTALSKGEEAVETITAKIRNIFNL